VLVAGIMSGTSVDGIDVAFAEITGQGSHLSAKTVAFSEIPFQYGIREQVLAVSDADVSTAAISQTHYLLGQVFAKALVIATRQAGLELAELDLVGCHGQTVYHQGEPALLCGRPVSSTMQLGEAAFIAQASGSPVVSDFRAGDIASGGQGAPIVPYVDYMLLRHNTLNRVALNIGGIANLTALPAGSAASDVIAFDTGPGNMVMDQIASAISDGVHRFDRDGRMALSGRPDEKLLSRLLSDSWYARPPPKSTGRERYGLDFVRPLLKLGLPPASLMATAATLTVRTIVGALERFVKPEMGLDEVLVSGGGWRNPALIGPLRANLPKVRVRGTDELGIATDAKEALAIAVIAYETFHRRPANLPSATGASRAATLGRLTWP